jgi:spore coat polysaccharide biosynthesis protein SpsF (cytidylyltransferase family)
MAKADSENIVFDYLINQLKHSKLIEKIILATTTNKEDDLIVEFAKKNQIEFFRGNESDVLDRYYQCAKNFSSKNILRITSDNPLVDPTIIDDLIINYQKISCDYASNNLVRTYPLGLDAEIFSFHTLEKTWKNAILPSDREHVSPYMKKNSNIFKQFNLRNKIKVPLLRLTIDRKEDLELFRIVIFKIPERPILMDNILELYNNEPKLFEINSHIDSLEGFNKSTKYDKEFLKNQDS